MYILLLLLLKCNWINFHDWKFIDRSLKNQKNGKDEDEHLTQSFLSFLDLKKIHKSDSVLFFCFFLYTGYLRPNFIVARVTTEVTKLQKDTKF